MSYHGFTLNSFTPASFDQYDFTPQNIAAIAGASIFFLYCIIPYLGPLPQSISYHLWNLFVYLVPSRIVAALDAENKDSNTHYPLTYSTFSDKKQAMRRIIGFEKGSLDSILPRGRRLSSLGNALLGNRDLIPPGLGNWDNSCYQNSVIQGLASLQSFADYLDRNIYKLDTRSPLSTHHALKDIIEKLNDSGNHGQKLWIPPELKSMSSWQQQDAQEYFSKIADQLDREVRDASKTITTNSGLRILDQRENFLGVSKIGDEKLVEEDPRRPNIIHNPLEGLLAQRVGCIRCGWTEGLSLIPFNCLTVSLGKNDRYDIRDCLDDYMALETIEGVECAKCTLLRTQDQLKHLLQQIKEDDDLAKGPEASNVSSTLKNSAQERLQAVQQALDEEDFTEKALSKKCHIPSKNRVSATKSRQAVIARSPKNLVIHVNRSVFDENTGALRKNSANVVFPPFLDLGEWCLGTRNSEKEKDSLEVWDTNPQASMLPTMANEVMEQKYELRAVLTHFGRHDNGHYICYRKFSSDNFTAGGSGELDGEKEINHRWFRLSDEDVRFVNEDAVFAQGGVFMLFYERVDETPSDQQDVVDELREKDLNMETGPTCEIFHEQGKAEPAISEIRNTTLTDLTDIDSKTSSSETSDTSMGSQFSSARLTQTTSGASNLIDAHENVKHQELPNGHSVTV